MPPRPALRLAALAVALAAAPLSAQAPGTGTAAPAATPAPDLVAPLAWLAGCWELRTATRVTREQWMAPAGGLMLGLSRTVVRGVAREFEYLRIEARDGRAAYVAQPGGRPPTAFGATHVSDTAAVFEAPAHDFPQVIRYRRLGADSLLARIEGPQGGTTRAIDFPMARVRCD